MKTGFEKRERAMGRLIGLGGKLRAGKDEVGDHLEKKNFVKMGMSDALNEALLKLDPWIPLAHTDMTPSTLYGSFMRYSELHERLGYVEAKKYPDVRRLLQVLGTEVGREMIDQDVWVDIAEKRIRALWAEGKDVVITAVRFPNEVEMIRRLGGTTVWIERPDEARGVTEGVNEGHASENSVSDHDFDVVIENDRDLDHLYSEADRLLTELETLLADEEPLAQHQGYWGAVQQASKRTLSMNEYVARGFFPPYDR